MFLLEIGDKGDLEMGGKAEWIWRCGIANVYAMLHEPEEGAWGLMGGRGYDMISRGHRWRFNFESAVLFLLGGFQGFDMYEHPKGDLSKEGPTSGNGYIRCLRQKIQ